MQIDAILFTNHPIWVPKSALISPPFILKVNHIASLPSLYLLAASQLPALLLPLVLLCDSLHSYLLLRHLLLLHLCLFIPLLFNPVSLQSVDCALELRFHCGNDAKFYHDSAEENIEF